MSNCCFFGHSKISTDIRKELRETILELISENDIDEFYVGNNGAFDHYVIEILNELRKENIPVRFTVLIAYLNTDYNIDHNDTVYPEGLETVPKRFAVSKRNLWMLNQCDYVISYIDHPFGNAEKFVDTAIRKGKIVINIADRIKKH